jgi:serine/threonine protein kinase/tetratricopeptide (TPR) repeat protein
MTGGQYTRAKQLFLAVCDLSPSARAAALDEECGDDIDLRAEVESLVAHYDGPTATMGESVGKERVEPPEEAPQRVGHYRILREIGRGGMGVVYAGVSEDDRFKRRVAIKVLRRGMDTDEVLRRFEFERQVLAGLNHAGIARLYDAGETDERLPYFAMEYVEGQPVDEYCDTHRLRIPERLELFRAVCSAVHYAHKNLVVHRDLKPGNILVTKDGTPKLLDFGIAKVINPDLSFTTGLPTAPDSRIMTPEYASPEQVRGDPITTASDIYSLGVILYELVSGHRPYHLKRRVRAEIERIICEVDPDKPSTAISRIEEVETAETESSDATTTITPEQVGRARGGRPDRLRRKLAGDIDNIVLFAMRKEPQRRYESAEQFGEDIERHLKGMPVKARRDTAGYRVVKFVGRHRAGVGAAAAIAFLLAGLVVSTAWGKHAADVQRDQTRDMFEQVRDLAHTFMFEFHDEIQELDGALPARELLVTTALEYLDNLSQRAGDDTGLRRELASGYDRVGDIRGGIRNPSLGETQEAMANYVTALQLRRELVAAVPDNLEIQKELSTSLMKVGDMHMHGGDTSAGLAKYREALELRERLADKDASYRRTLYIGLNNVGQALVAIGEFDDAEQYYKRSLKLRRQAANAEKANRVKRRDVSVQLIDLGELFEVSGDYPGAYDTYLDALQIRQGLARDDRADGRAKRDVAVTHFLVARVLLALERPGDASNHIAAFMKSAQERARDNPGSTRAQKDLALGHEISGQLHAANGDIDAALDSYREFQAVAMSLSESRPDNAPYQEVAADSYERLAEALAMRGELASASRSYEEALSITRQLVETDAQNFELKVDEARLLSALGAIDLSMERLTEATWKLDRARTSYEDLVRKQKRHAKARWGLVTTLRHAATIRARAGDRAGARELTGTALEWLEDAPPGPETEALRRALEKDLAGP